MAISSEGVIDVLDRAVGHLLDDQFPRHHYQGIRARWSGRVFLVAEAVERALGDAGLSLPLVAIGRTM